MEAGIPMQFDEFGNVRGKFLFLDVHKAPFIDANGNMIGTVGSGRDITEYKRFEKEIIFKKNIIESSSCAIATSDLEGKVTFGNTFFQQLWGFDNINDFVGKPFWELWLLEDQRDSIKKTLLSGKNWSGELKAKKKDGTIFDIQVTAAPVFDDDSNLCALTSTSIDITERKWMENKLKRNEKLYRTLFSDSHTPIFMVDEKSRSYIDANQSALAFMECTKEQLVGRSVYENSPPETIEQTKNEHANFSEVKSLETEYLVNDKIKTLLLEVTPLELDGDRILIGIRAGHYRT
jgi:PAS domain S-box-containing protein